MALCVKAVIVEFHFLLEFQNQGIKLVKKSTPCGWNYDA